MATDLLLEHYHNTVTQVVNEHGGNFEVAKSRCRCWYCEDCCKVMGYDVRKKLVPILETFSGLLLVTLTVDPTLFSDPKSAYLYMMKRRVIARTVQDLYRWGCLSSRRYFYVIEWQEKTEQVHFHVLLDAQFIPFDRLLKSWSKHRPKDAGPTVGDRPKFGTVLVSKARFEGGPAHAARYVTKYLVKNPEHGFPQWVLQMGRKKRIRRFSTSRGFWGNPESHACEGGERHNPPKQRARRQVTARRRCEQRTYAERIEACGASVNVFQIRVGLDRETGELLTERRWVGQLRADAKLVMNGLSDPGDPRRSRRSLMASSLSHVQKIISAAIGEEAVWIRGGPMRSWQKAA